MITAIRRLFSSKIGTIVALIFLALVAISFAGSDITGSSSNLGGGVSGGNVARIGDRQVGTGELRDRIRRAFDQQRQQNPGMTMAAFIEAGGADDTLKSMLDGYALDEYAHSIGLTVSKRQVDAEIADLPQVKGVTGKYDPAVLKEFLKANGISEIQLREDIARQILLSQLVAPVGTIPRLPASIAAPYGALILESREGLATFIPSSKFAPTTAPDDKELAKFLSENRARFTIPERRTLRYAVFDRSSADAVTVSDADIAAAYKANAATFAAKDSRRFSQVIAPSEAVARTIADKAKSGSLDAAARTSGLAASTVTPVDAADLQRTTNAALAKSAFSAPQGGIVGPVKVALGWAVLKVESVTNVPAQSLAAATPQIREELLATKRNEEIIDFYNGIQDAVNNGVSLTEIANDRKFEIRTTPAVLSNGQAVTEPSFKADVALSVLLPQAFQSASEGEAQLATLKENDVFAVFEVSKITAAAPPPLADIREPLTNAWRLKQGSRQARDKARAIVKAVDGGQALAAASTAVGGTVGAPQSIGGKRADMAKAGQRVPPELALLFSMAAKTAKTLELPGDAGWMVLFLDTVNRPAAKDVPEAVIASVAQPLQGAIGNELVQQLINAAKAKQGVSIDAGAMTLLKRELSGNAPAAE